MSRTYRRKTGNQYRPRSPDQCWENVFRVRYADHPEYAERMIQEQREWGKQFRARFHRDRHWQGNVARNVKHAAKKKIRLAWRKEKARFLKDFEYDIPKLEKIAKGEIWNWD